MRMAMRIARPSFSMSRISILILALSFSYSAVVVNANATATSPLVQTLETQIWDASSESWKSSLWTSENDVKEQATSPLQQLQDKTGNWKILLRPGRDSLGWQYEYRGHQLAPNRRRVWLHKTILSPPQQVSPATETSPNLSTKSTKKRTLLSLTKTRNKLLNPITSSVAKVRDDFHFKGFGMSLYKSMLYKYSCGIAFRLPILANWDGWDRRPQLPSLSSQICLYYPPTIAVCVSSSINMEWWQYICQIMYSSLKQFLRLLLYQVLRGFYVVGSWLLYPVLRRVTELPTTLTKPTPLASPTYQSDIQERLGMTVSYRWSLTRGREWRVSYWHMYLPTIQVYRQCLGRLSLITPTLFQTKLDWCARHFMSLGVDTSAVPDPSLQPNFSCTALVSLSGLYLQSKQRKTNLVTTATAAPSVKVSLSREQAILPAILIEQSQKTQQQRDVSILFSSFASSSSEETAATAPKIPVPAATSTSASSTFNKKTTATATATSTKTTTHSNSIVPIARGGDLQNKYGYLFGRIPPPPPPPTKHTLDLLNTHD